MKGPIIMPDTLKFALGDRVKHKCGDEEDNAGVVTGIMFRPVGVLYEVSWGPSDESSHYELELDKSTDTITA